MGILSVNQLIPIKIFVNAISIRTSLYPFYAPIKRNAETSTSKKERKKFHSFIWSKYPRANTSVYSEPTHEDIMIIFRWGTRKIEWPEIE